MIDLDDELAEGYLAECREHLVTLETDLLAIERDGAGTDEEGVNRAFRAVHSVKGGAGFFDLLKIRELAHQTEDVLAKVRSRKLALRRNESAFYCVPPTSCRNCFGTLAPATRPISPKSWLL